MRAVRVHEWGAPPVVEAIDEPVPADGRTIIRIAAATVGHVDRTIWSGGFLRPPALPYTPGVEASGVVVRSERFAVGDRVWVRGGGLGTVTDGTWAELVSAPDGAVGPLPDAVGHAVGATFFSPCASAWVALHTIARLAASHRVAITGATGAVGSIAVQLAGDAGADVVAVVSSERRLGLLPSTVEGVSAAEPLDGLAVDVLVDTVGGPVLEAILPSVRPGGLAVLVGYVAGTRVTLDLAQFMQRDVALHPLNMIRREDEGRAAAPDLLARLADGRLRLDVTTFGLDQSHEAMRWLTTSGHVGRAVLLIGGQDP